MTSKAKKNNITFEERAAMLADWERSGLSQREFSEQRGLPVRTFEYYRRQQLRQEGSGQRRSPAGEATRLVPVRIAPAVVAPPPAPGDDGFALTLLSGRRIEAGWGFCETALTRLLRVAEQA